MEVAEMQSCRRVGNCIEKNRNVIFQPLDGINYKPPSRYKHFGSKIYTCLCKRNAGDSEQQRTQEGLKQKDLPSDIEIGKVAQENKNEMENVLPTKRNMSNQWSEGSCTRKQWLPGKRKVEQGRNWHSKDQSKSPSTCINTAMKQSIWR